MAPAMSIARRVAQVLDCFGPSDPELGIREIARRSSLPPSTTHRLVAELLKLGYLERSANGRVMLGLALFELGQLVPRQRNLRDIALPFMEDLQQATRQTVHLAVRDGDEVVYVEILGNRGTDLPSRVGGRMPAYCTGVGKAILAFSDPEVVTASINAGLAPRTEHTITDNDRLLANLAEVRSTGIAFDKEESGPGILCAASPIRARNGDVVGALSVTGRSGLVSLDHVGIAVQAVASALSRRIVYPPSRDQRLSSGLRSTPRALSDSS